MDWIFHGKNFKNKYPIFSIDIQPFGKYIATSGQDSLVKIWTDCFRYSKIFQNKTIIKQKNRPNYSNYQKKSPLFIFEPQRGSISVVRWAPHGLLLASGGDEGCLTVYERIRNPIKKSMWRVFEVFKKHTGDIIDLIWSPTGSLIGTVSLDNNIYIWSIDKKSIFIQLSSCFIWVKGICWDISGKILITLSENLKIIFWDTKKWKIYKILDLKKKKSTQKINLFNRSCWSTCGSNLIVCGATSKKKIPFSFLTVKIGFLVVFLLLVENFYQEPSVLVLGYIKANVQSKFFLFFH